MTSLNVGGHHQVRGPQRTNADERVVSPELGQSFPLLSWTSEVQACQLGPLGFTAPQVRRLSDLY
jgi:hypothetical protein